MVGRKKGTAKTGGRKKGTPNKITPTAKEWVNGILSDNWEQMQDDLRKLEPKERLQLLFKLLDYVLPKQNAVTAKVSYDDMTDEQLADLVNHLTEGVKDENTDR